VEPTRSQKRMVRYLRSGDDVLLTYIDGGGCQPISHTC